MLSKVEGKFLLSSYRNPVLTDYNKKCKWESIEIKMVLSSAARFLTKKQKVEVLTANYPIADKIKAD
jgi:DNA adenine methylase